MSLSEQNPLAFLCGHRKSGTTLLSNLLDGHPQLAVYPADLALLYAYFPDFVARHTNSKERRARLERILFVDLRERLGSLPLNIDALAQAFFDGLSDEDLGRVETLIARLMSAFRSVAGEGNGARWSIFKETSIEIYAAEMRTWFPEARFLGKKAGAPPQLRQDTN